MSMKPYNSRSAPLPNCSLLHDRSLPRGGILTMHLTKPLASLSLDLDNQWSYMKIHGDAGWESFPSYLDIVTPRVLDFLRERDLTISVFIVGQDAALEKNRDSLAAIVAAGHEVGNHSFLHEPWLHLYAEEQ